MILIVGLGNPGEKHQKTWHNIGFLAVDFFSRKKNFPDFKFEKKLKSEISEGRSGEEKIILAKPQTFMNSSGSAVILLMRRWKIKDSDILVLQDDIDLPFGKIRISRSRGTAGHNGIESIMKTVGTKDFTRIRIGIQPSSGKPRHPEKFVLQKIDKEGNLKDVFRKTDKAIEMILEGRTAEAMSEYNK
ncbi:MAG: aminoacyl-tRNA hydrolase [bacterium]|nr:aminoacyl-tRNA hydrolase [bacterium]